MKGVAGFFSLSLSLFCSNISEPVHVFKEREYPGKGRQWAERARGCMYVCTTNKSYAGERKP